MGLANPTVTCSIVGYVSMRHPSNKSLILRLMIAGVAI